MNIYKILEQRIIDDPDHSEILTGLLSHIFGKFNSVKTTTYLQGRKIIKYSANDIYFQFTIDPKKRTVKAFLKIPDHFGFIDLSSLLKLYNVSDIEIEKICYEYL